MPGAARLGVANATSAHSITAHGNEMAYLQKKTLYFKQMTSSGEKPHVDLFAIKHPLKK